MCGAIRSCMMQMMVTTHGAGLYGCGMGDDPAVSFGGKGGTGTNFAATRICVGDTRVHQLPSTSEASKDAVEWRGARRGERDDVGAHSSGSRSTGRDGNVDKASVGRGDVATDVQKGGAGGSDGNNEWGKASNVVCVCV